MFATLTSKGQLTLPKEIRDRLGLDAGAILDFRIQADNTITARRVQPDARRVRGLLKSPLSVPPTVEQMDEAVSKDLRDKQLRNKQAVVKAGRKSTGR
jgi:antitoxin PrlF